jgi:hypothetical protein
MAFLNGTVKIHIEFVTSSGSHADASNIQLRVLTTDGILVETISITDTDKIDVGVYEKNYTLPIGYTEVIGEVSGLVGDTLVVGTVEIDSMSSDFDIATYLKEMKSALQIAVDDTSKDGYLTTIIPFLVNYIQTKCKQDFLNTAGQLELPKGLKLAMAQMIQIELRGVGIESQSFEDFDIKFTDNYPDTVMQVLDAYTNRSISFV